MKQITNKEYDEWQKYKEEKAKGHIVKCIYPHNCPVYHMGMVRNFKIFSGILLQSAFQYTAINPDCL